MILLLAGDQAILRKTMFAARVELVGLWLPRAQSLPVQVMLARFPEAAATIVDPAQAATLRVRDDEPWRGATRGDRLDRLQSLDHVLDLGILVLQGKRLGFLRLGLDHRHLHKDAVPSRGLLCESDRAIGLDLSKGNGIPARRIGRLQARKLRSHVFVRDAPGLQARLQLGQDVLFSEEVRPGGPRNPGVAGHQPLKVLGHPDRCAYVGVGGALRTTAPQSP